MTRFPEVAARYAGALFDLAQEQKKAADYFSSLKLVANAILSDAAVSAYIESPLILAKEKLSAIEKGIVGKGLPKDVENFLMVLAKKGRLNLLPDILTAYQARQDEADGIVRGTVKSAAELNDAQRKEIERVVSARTNKKVILDYVLDTNLIGGLSIQVGSLRFDDAISSHLNKMKDELTRSLH